MENDGEMTNLLEDDQPTEGLGDIVINKEVSREEALAQEETELDLDDISLEPDLVLGEETDSEDGMRKYWKERTTRTWV
ncbi:hypothetical protein ACFL7M_14970 [Thermodesulfobacteriota bacterium]